MTMNDFRKLKIHTKYRIRKYDETKIPEIRLEGKWLENIGFKRGQTVKIKQQNTKLTITVAYSYVFCSLFSETKGLAPLIPQTPKVKMQRVIPLCRNPGMSSVDP